MKLVAMVLGCALLATCVSARVVRGPSQEQIQAAVDPVLNAINKLGSFLGNPLVEKTVENIAYLFNQVQAWYNSAEGQQAIAQVVTDANSAQLGAALKEIESSALQIASQIEAYLESPQFQEELKQIVSSVLLIASQFQAYLNNPQLQAAVSEVGQAIQHVEAGQTIKGTGKQSCCFAY
jgi:hypothetical protein